MLKRLTAVALGALALVLSTGGPAAALNKCAVAKKKAVCKKVCCLLKADEKAELKGVAVDPLAIAKCKQQFVAAFTKIEASGTCVTSGDATAIEAKIDSFVDDVVAELNPASTTTTTTSTTTTTCPPPQSFIINTGRNSGAVGSADPIWQLTAAPFGATEDFPGQAEIIAPNGSWAAAQPSSEWVSANTQCNDFTDECPPGDYTYALCWTQCTPCTGAPDTLDLLADNSATVYFNSVEVGATPASGFTAPPTHITFPCDSSNAVNTLQVVVHNNSASAAVCNATCTASGMPFACCTGSGTGTCTSCGTPTGMDLSGFVNGSGVVFVPCPICQRPQPQQCTCGDNMTGCAVSCGNPGATCADQRQPCIDVCASHGGSGSCATTPCTDCAAGGQPCL
jgi:hypothetical protein